MATKPIYAWHFLALDDKGRPVLRDGRPKPPAGRTLAESKAILCKRGLHASIDPLAALSYAPGPYLCRVKLHGQVVKGDDKAVATRRTIIYGFDASRVLRLFACWCARNTPLADGRTTWDLLTDPRSRAAVEVAERFAVGEATREELDAADAAARFAWASWAAAMDAAMAAARSAWAAADAAAWAAADAAADAAAWAAADAAQSKQLSIMLEAEAKRLHVFRNDK